MALQAGKVGGWIARLLFFGLLSACILLVQADRSSRSNRSLVELVPAGFGGNADEIRARTIVLEDPELALPVAAGIVAARPVSASHLGLLGLAAAESGDQELAAAALSLGARRGWRDDYTQIAVLGSYSASGDYEAAMQRLEALVRTQRPREIVRAALLDLASREDAQDELMALVGPNETLQRRLMAMSAEFPDIIGPLTRSMQAAEAMTPPPSCAMLNDLTRIHLRRNLGTDAAASWPQRCERAGMEGFGFASLTGADDYPFRWSVSNAVGVSVFPSSDGEGVTMINRSPLKQEIALRYLQLAAGPHRLAVDLGDATAQFTPVVDLAIRCVEGRPARLLGSLETRTSDAFEFVVPEDCPAQRLNVRMRKGRVDSMRLTGS